MCFIATIRSPLRSKRATISPVRPRSNASGFTRMSVRSISPRTVGDRGRRGPDAEERRSQTSRPCGRPGGLPRRHRPGGRCRPPRTPPCSLHLLADLGLAVRADLPARVERLAADGAGLLQAPQAARAAEERLLDLEAAVLALLVLEIREPGLRRGDLDLALTYVHQVLGRANDEVHDRPDEREQRCRGGARDEHRVRDPAMGVAVRPVHQREPDDHEEQQQQVDRQSQPVVFDAEQGNQAHERRECTGGAYRKSRPSAYPMPKNTRITVATTTATSPIIAPKRGPSPSISVNSKALVLMSTFRPR